MKDEHYAALKVFGATQATPCPSQTVRCGAAKALALVQQSYYDETLVTSEWLEKHGFTTARGQGTPRWFFSPDNARGLHVHLIELKNLFESTVLGYRLNWGPMTVTDVATCGQVFRLCAALDICLKDAP